MNAISHAGAAIKPVERGPTQGQRPVERTLCRTGHKAIRFEGWQLVEAVGTEGRGAIWYDLNVFATVNDTVIVQLIVRRHAADEQDLFKVKTFRDLQAAARWLEAYRCADDIPIPVGLFPAETALPWAVLQAVHLRQRLDRVENDFRVLLSAVFDALDLTDSPEVEESAV